MTLTEKLQQILSQSEEATPEGKAWIPHPTGMHPETMRSMGILSSHNHTPYIGWADARFIASSRVLVPALARALGVAVGALSHYNAEAMRVGSTISPRHADKALAEIANILLPEEKV